MKKTRKEYVVRRKAKSSVNLLLMLSLSIFLILITAFLFLYVLQFENGIPISNDVSVSFEEPKETVPFINNVTPTAIDDTVSHSPTPSLDGTSDQLLDWQLVLVNADHEIPFDYEQTIVHKFDFDMDNRMIEPYTNMYHAASKENINLWLSSAYRDYSTQEKLFKNEIRNHVKNGMTEMAAEIAAEKAVQRPGFSEHNTGLAVDFNGVSENFKDDPGYLWLERHAEEYGFILRYPENKQEITGIMFEPWHYRYVGVEHAAKMKELGLCLEEYIEYIKKHESESISSLSE